MCIENFKGQVHLLRLFLVQDEISADRRISQTCAYFQNFMLHRSHPCAEYGSDCLQLQKAAAIIITISIWECVCICATFDCSTWSNNVYHFLACCNLGLRLETFVAKPRKPPVTRALFSKMSLSQQSLFSGFCGPSLCGE